MTRVRIVGRDDVELEYELMSSETSRKAISSYDRLPCPIDNALELQSASLGAALALLNDLDWYLRRYADWAAVLEPSISEEEWLSRKLATRVYERDLDPSQTEGYYAIHGVKDGELLEPMYVRSPSEYDLHETDYVVVTRITEKEF